MRNSPVRKKPLWLLTMGMLIVAALILINRGVPETAAQARTQSQIIAERAVDFPADI